MACHIPRCLVLSSQSQDDIALGTWWQNSKVWLCSVLVWVHVYVEGDEAGRLVDELHAAWYIPLWLKWEAELQGWIHGNIFSQIIGTFVLLQHFQITDVAFSLLQRQTLQGINQLVSNDRTKLLDEHVLLLESKSIIFPQTLGGI
jgi:hypothetical protein